MLSHCLNCRQKTESVNARVLKTCRTMILPKCAICGSKI